MKKSMNVSVITLCDVDEQFYNEWAKPVVETYGIAPKFERNMRNGIEAKDTHVVSFATPYHWHAVGTIWSCQAWKHVYVEKPFSHNIIEGRKMIEASRKYNARVQVGFQNRSGSNLIEAMKFLHNGGSGEVYMARGLCFKPRDSFGIVKDSTPPATLHYERWLGPARRRQYNKKRVHYNWHWFWDIGCRDTGNQGPHQFEVACWGLSKNKHPVSIFSTGGIYRIDPKECEQEPPNTQTLVFKSSGGKILGQENRGRNSIAESSEDISIGNIFYGTDGYLELKSEEARPWKSFRNWGKTHFAGSKEEMNWQVLEMDLVDSIGSSEGSHWSNLIDAIRSGKDEYLSYDIIEGHYSTALPHLAIISYRLQRELKFMSDYEKFINDT